MRVQATVSPTSGRRSYTLLDDQHRPIGPVEMFLCHLEALDCSPNTIKAYAHDLRDFFGWLQAGRDWRCLQLIDVGDWVSWLRRPPELRRAGVPVFPTVSTALTERTLERKLATVAAFYTFHARHDPAVILSLTHWVSGRTGHSQHQPFLAHAATGGHRRQIKVRGQLHHRPQVIDRADLRLLLTACQHLRDRFLFTTLFETGMRAGEVLGLRHRDLVIAKNLVRIEPRHNANQARVKGWKARTVPVNPHLFTLYADYMDEEYAAVDSDYVFVNLWGGRSGAAMTYATLRSLVLRLRAATGLAEFTPHQLRHTYATDLIRRGTDWAVVQQLLGHASIQSTLGIYGHLTAEDAREALITSGWFDRSWINLTTADHSTSTVTADPLPTPNQE